MSVIVKRRLFRLIDLWLTTAVIIGAMIWVRAHGQGIFLLAIDPGEWFDEHDLLFLLASLLQVSLFALEHYLLKAFVFLIINIIRKIDLTVGVSTTVDSTIRVIFVHWQCGLLISILFGVAVDDCQLWRMSVLAWGLLCPRLQILK